MPFDAVRVEGLAQLERSLREVGRDIQANLSHDLLVAAQPAKAVAEQLGVQRIRGIRQSGWNEMKLGTSGALVYMAPAKRGNRRSRRPNFGRLLVEKAMVPALAAAATQIEAGAGRAVDRAIRTAGF